VPLANLLFSGSGSNRTLTVTPALNQYGSAMITVRVQDLDGLSASAEFLLTVQPVNDPPTLSTIPDQSTEEDTPLTIAFSVFDVETPAGALALHASSSDPVLVPETGFEFGGSGTNRTFTLRPGTNQFGAAIITVRVIDADSGTNETSFVLTVNAVPDLPTITSQPLDITVPAGETAMLAVVAEGLLPLAYQWQRESADLPGETNATLVIAQVQAIQAGGYSVFVTGPEGSVTSRVAQVTVTVRPTLGAMHYAGGQMSFSFLARKGSSYVVEHAETVDAAVWTAWPPIVGEGEVYLFTDTNAPPANRFYRLRVE
jgi:hypothetical protein